MKILFTQKNILSAMVLMFITLATTSCNKKIMFQNSAVVPAAKGYVKVSKDHNNNYVVSVTITDLAEVKRLQPPKQTYIVWLVSNEQNTKNVGQIISNSSTLSSRLKANFETTS